MISLVPSPKHTTDTKYSGLRVICIAYPTTAATWLDKIKEGPCTDCKLVASDSLHWANIVLSKGKPACCHAQVAYLPGLVSIWVCHPGAEMDNRRTSELMSDIGVAQERPSPVPTSNDFLTF